MPHERRHFVRVDFDAPALLTLADRTRPVRVLDLSLKGALIGLPDPEGVDVGWLGQLSMPLAQDGEQIAMSVEVAHLEGHKAGLLCHAIDLDSVTHLRRLIELHLGDPALLERDLAELTHTAPPL